MKKLKLVALLSLVALTSIVMVACNNNEEQVKSSFEGQVDLAFEVGFTKLIVGDDYYIDSRIVKSVAELDEAIGGFGFSDVLKKYSETYFSSKSVILVSFYATGTGGTKVENLRTQGKELFVECTTHFHPEPNSFVLRMVFIETDKDSVAKATSIKEELWMEFR
ncbi:MAG: hypothetical protein FWF18_05880 [Dehalococcoidia bacterium]|nr:hypothetical protein [Dehalococcoidia bacterium]